MAEPWILGVSTSHNGAACLLRGDALVVAIQEERLCGVKRARITDARNSLAVAYCLAHAGISLGDLDVMVTCRFSGTTRSRELESDSSSSSSHISGQPARVLAISHHLGHAHAVVATSGLSDAAVLIIDGQGGHVDALPDDERTPLRRGVVPGHELSTPLTEVASIYRADLDGIRLVEKHAGDAVPCLREPLAALRPPRSLQPFGSLGGMYMAVSGLVFADWMQAGKVMGLAPYGRAIHGTDELFTIDDSGCFHYSDRLLATYRELAPWPANQERFADLAASVQAALEHGVLHLARRTRELSGHDRLCYAGGVALNSVANERLIRELGFDDVFIMPAAEDSGTAIGAAYYGLRALRGTRPATRRATSDAVGRRYARADIDAAVANVPHVELIAAADHVIDTAVSLLCDQQIIGWFDGGSELGPRALGQRSILCDPRRVDGKDILNARVKQRESFRPFAPAILRDEVERWFDVAPGQGDSPFMLRVVPFAETAKQRVPAVVHVDGTGRLQTLTAEDNPRLYRLVARFHERTGVPLVLNTSLNRAGEPIAETPDDALWCLLGTGLDAVVFEHIIVRKQAAYRSLLQLYPRVRARQARLSVPIGNGVVDLAVRADSELSMVIDTRWGEAVTRIPPADLRLFQLCDGSRDGFAIVDELARSSFEPVDEMRVARQLYHYRRMSLVELRASAWS